MVIKMFELDKLKEECGVFGVWGPKDSSRLGYLGLYALQHRGQEAAGMVSLDKPGGKLKLRKGLGLVADVFTEKKLDELGGMAVIGHVRYSTTGDANLSNAQPLMARIPTGDMSLCHNGNLTNAKSLRSELLKSGAIFQGTSDTEVFLHLMARSAKPDLKSALITALKQVQGAFSLLIVGSDGIIAVRDPLGFRPLWCGSIKADGKTHYVFASETCAFDLIEAKIEFEVEPGELVEISESGIKRERWSESSGSKQCVFELIYFSRPDSRVFGQSVYEARKRMGAMLAKEAPVEADVVVPVPDSGVAAAIGYSIESGLQFEMGIIRNHYVGRTFIQPYQTLRSFGVRVKLNPQESVLKGKRVILLDDSIVRGTTSQKVVQLVKSAGAKEVHLRISSPPTTGPCYYGVDTPSRQELIASKKSSDEIAKYIGADSLAYLSIEGMLSAVGGSKQTYCAACFDGDYPTPIEG